METPPASPEATEPIHPTEPNAPTEPPEPIAPLDAIEGRVLGCLIEKQLTTPEYYPLTLKALTAACNQQSNRLPVMALAETDVVRGLDRLQAKGLSLTTHQAGARVPKYRHGFTQKFPVREPEAALVAELLLRGPQTAGELKGRAGRMRSFVSLEAVEEALGRLAEREPPLALLLPRQAGQKERRWTHLLSGMPEVSEEAPSPARPEAATLAVRSEDERISKLEAEVKALREELEAFKRQFE
jgi:uncharacterized protein YceH (UPF0502 family)